MPRQQLHNPTWIAAWLVVAFLCFAAVGNALLPERFSADTVTMVEGVEDKSGLDTSYQRMSETIELLSYEGTTLLTVILGAFVVHRLARTRRTVGSLSVVVLSLVAAAPLGLIRPQKELYVLLLTILVMVAIYRVRPSRQVIAICALYFTYAFLMGRSYYVGIVIAFLIVRLLHRCSTSARIVALIAVVASGLFLPLHLLEPIHSARDALNLFRVLDASEPGNRTAFMNLYGDVGWLEFLANYGYAALRLNVPLVFSQHPQELFLTLITVTWAVLVIRSLRSERREAQLAASLIVAHVAVLNLFEPDLGSYLRHLSSVLVYLFPLLELYDDRALEV